MQRFAYNYNSTLPPVISEIIHQPRGNTEVHRQRNTTQVHLKVSKWVLNSQSVKLVCVAWGPGPDGPQPLAGWKGHKPFFLFVCCQEALLNLLQHFLTLEFIGYKAVIVPLARLLIGFYMLYYCLVNGKLKGHQNQVNGTIFHGFFQVYVKDGLREKTQQHNALC